jgi:hypothetical protein
MENIFTYSFVNPIVKIQRPEGSLEWREKDESGPANNSAGYFAGSRVSQQTSIPHSQQQRRDATHLLGRDWKRQL